MVYKTAVNQPDRLFLSSNNDDTNPATSNFSRFDIRLRTPVINAKRCQLLRATIPNALVNIPDYALQFWYYKWAVSAGNTAANRVAANLKCVRIMPTNWAAPGSVFASMPSNKYYATPSDLVVAMNQAAANDNSSCNAYYTANDVAFSYDGSSKKISMTGADSTYYYEPVGYNSANIAIGAVNTFVPDYTYSTATTTTYQARVPGINMNLRLGYSQPNDGVGAWKYVQIGGVPIVFDSYPNLIYTQCYYIYSNLVANSTLGSNGSHTILAVIPTSSATLAVTNYTALTVNWLCHVPDSITTASIEIRDDNDQLVPLPDSINVNLEVGFKFDE